MTQRISASPAQGVPVLLTQNSRILTIKSSFESIPQRTRLQSVELILGGASPAQIGLSGGSDNSFTTLPKVTSDLDSDTNPIERDDENLDVNQTDGSDATHIISDEPQEDDWDPMVFLTKELIEKDERMLTRIALGKATEICFEWATFIRECEIFKDEHGNEVDSCEKALKDIDVFVEVILSSTIENLSSDGVREMETSRSSPVIKNYFQ